jgi:hypothetical protein
MRGVAHVAEHGPDAGVGQDRVERGGEARSAVADHELDPMCLSAEVHEEVAGLLGCPLPGGMGSDPEDADTPAGALYHSQDVGLGAVEQAGREEVAGQDRLGLGSARIVTRQAPVRRRAGSMPLAMRISHTVDAATLTPKPASPPWILR